MNNTKLIKGVISLVLGIGGFVLIGIFSSWLVALGVFLMMWSNNQDYVKAKDFEKFLHEVDKIL